MRRSWIYCVGFFLCCVFVWIIIKANNTSVDAPAESNYSIPRLVQYSFTLQNRSNRLLKKAEFWTHAPVKQTPTQKCCQGSTLSHRDTENTYRIYILLKILAYVNWTINNRLFPKGWVVCTIVVSRLDKKILCASVVKPKMSVSVGVRLWLNKI